MGKKYGKPCDIWSIGTIAYVLVSGLAPYKADSFESELEDILDHKLSFDDPIFDDITEEGIYYKKIYHVFSSENIYSKMFKD